MTLKNTKYHSVILPCKPHILKYILSVYGSPFKATNKTTLGSFITMCLDKNIYTNRVLNQPVRTQHFTAKLNIQISQWQFVNIGFDFAPEKVIEINRFIENIFEDHLCNYVEARYKPGCGSRNRIIEEFAEKFNIELEYDITTNALIKMEYRRRVEIEKNILNTAKDLRLFA